MIRNILEKTALGILGVAVALITLELGVRLVPNSLLPQPARHLLLQMELRARSLDHYLPDPLLWYVMRPGTDVMVEHPDYKFRMKTNLNYPRAGFRGGTLGGPPWGVAVGDSFTFGLGVDHEATWIAALARMAQREIINLGVPGWGPQQYTRTLEKYGIPLKPQIAFYGLYNNDLGNSKRFEKRDGHFNRFSTRKFLRLNSVTFNLFRSVRRSARQTVSDIELADLGLQFSSEALTEKFINDARRLEEAWPFTKREIEDALQECQKINATFVLLYFPSLEEVYWQRIREEEKSLEGFDDRVDQLRNNMVRFCQEGRLLCFDLTPALQKRAAARQKLYYPNDNHWTEEGNRVVGEAIHQFLLEKKVL